MPKSANEVFRDFQRFTGDGQANEPFGHPLPIGDPRSGVHNPSKPDIRDWAGGVDTAAARAEAAAGHVDALMTLAEVISGPEDARKRFAVNSAGTGYVLADRFKRFIFAYSQSNIALQGIGETWRYPPPPNLFVWNGGYWNGDMVPPLGNAFVPAASMPPMVAVAYAAELARQFPEDDFYLVMVARGGTSIRALAGMRYRWRSSGAVPASGDVSIAAGTSVQFHDYDLNGFSRMTGTADLGVSAFYPARIQATADATVWTEFECTAAHTDNGTWRSQPITGVGSANWPPADGTDVTVFPSSPRMRDVMSDVIPAAMNALGLVGDQRRIDKMLIWPTEST